MYAEGYIKKSS